MKEIFGGEISKEQSGYERYLIPLEVAAIIEEQEQDNIQKHVFILSYKIGLYNLPVKIF